MKILIILWAWSSVPSGIPSFRWESKANFNLDYFNINYIKKHNKIKDKELNNIIKYYKNLREEFKNKKQNDYHKYIKTLCLKHNCNIISQNIDDLDLDLNDNIIKLHWNLFRNKCLNNRKHKISKKIDIWDKCEKCNSLIIPNIQYYEELYPKQIIHRMNKLKKEKYDCILLIGTSLQIGYIYNFVKKLNSEFKININPELNLKLSWYLQYNNFKTFFNDIWKEILK